MALYLSQFTYTAEAWAKQINQPQDVRERVAAAAAKLGGRILHAWYGLHEYDLIIIIEYPDHVAMAAGAMLVAAGGAAKTIKTIPLLTIEEGMAAMQKAGETAGLYRPPGS